MPWRTDCDRCFGVVNGRGGVTTWEWSSFIPMTHVDSVPQTIQLVSSLPYSYLVLAVFFQIPDVLEASTILIHSSFYSTLK